MGNKKPRYPIREYLGKFESWMVVMRGGRIMRVYDDVLERFFATFPRKRGLEEFGSVDIADYKVLRQSQGISDRTLQLEMFYLRRFWRWLYEDQGLCLPIIKKAFRAGPWKASVKTLTLDQINLLLAACDSDDDRRIILNIMAGGKCPGKTVPSIKAAAHRIGLVGFGLGKLKMFVLNRLAREVIQAYCQQLLNALPQESKTASNSLRTVESSALDIRPSIGNDHNNSSSVSRVK